jgi:hypothetical protein
MELGPADPAEVVAIYRATSTLLLDIRREHPDASVPLILKTLVDEGRLAEGQVSEPTVRRLYVTLSEAAFSKEIGDGDLWLPPPRSKKKLVERDVMARLVGDPRRNEG